MKLNNDEITTVKQLVAKDVKFNETYIEVYDHVVTALESREPVTDILQAYTEIIDQDLGGHKGLAKLEYNYKKAFSEHVHKNKWATMGSYFKWPLLPATLLVAYGVFYFASVTGIREFFLPAVLGWVLGPTGILLMPRFMMMGKKEASIKRTIKYATVRSMGVYMYVMYTIGIIVCYFINLAVHHFDLIDNLSLSFPIIITVYFVFGTLHNIAIFKNYRNVYNPPVSL